MIISHKHKFIFIHLHKCAGTSITKSLIPFLGRKDIILGCTPKYEKISNQSRMRGEVFKHSTAQEIRQFVGEDIWREYYVFSFVRNPWDIVLSKYYWWHKTPANWNGDALAQKERIMKMTFVEFVTSTGKKSGFMDALLSAPVDDSGVITAQPSLDLDFIGRQETLEQDFSKVCQHLQLPKICLIEANTSHELREEKSYVSSYDQLSMERVAQVYAREIKEFGYSFDA